MKRRLSLSFIICIVLSLLLLNGCNSALPVFSSTDEGITDGEVSYSYLPDGWTFKGRLSKPFCKLENGAVYYTDSTQTFVRKQRKLFQDMENATLIRDTTELPDIHCADCIVNISFAQKNKADAALPEDAKAEFLSYYDRLNAETVRPGSVDRKTAAYVYYTFSDMDGLTFNERHELCEADNKLWLTDANGRYVPVGEESALYRFITNENSGK